MRSSAWPANERLEFWGGEEGLSDKRQAGTRGSELFMSTHRSGKTAARRGSNIRRETAWALASGGSDGISTYKNTDKI